MQTNHNLMEIINLSDRQNIVTDDKLYKIYIQFGILLSELRKKKLTDANIAFINDAIAELNALPADINLRKIVKQKQTTILKILEKEHKIVPKNYYRNIWLPVGMSAFGLPLGAAFGLAIGNIGLLSIGLPIGMAIGVGVGVNLDKKALTEGRQLDVEVKY